MVWKFSLWSCISAQSSGFQVVGFWDAQTACHNTIRAQSPAWLQDHTPSPVCSGETGSLFGYVALTAFPVFQWMLPCLPVSAPTGLWSFWAISWLWLLGSFIAGLFGLCFVHSGHFFLVPQMPPCCHWQQACFKIWGREAEGIWSFFLLTASPLGIFAIFMSLADKILIQVLDLPSCLQQRQSLSCFLPLLALGNWKWCRGGNCSFSAWSQSP